MNASLKRISQAMLYVGPLATLAISPAANFDPINPIKLMFITSLSFYAFGIFLAEFSSLKTRFSRAEILSFASFFIFLTLPLFFSGAPLTQQIWGSFGRNTGFLTYISLLLTLICISVIQDGYIYKKVLLALVLTSVLVSAYCLIQIAGLDPIGWSLKDTFATLGNTNFLSAFLGISGLACLAITLDKSFSVILRFLSVMLSLLEFLIALSTKSIQGVMIYIAGVGILFAFLIKNNRKIRFVYIPYLVLSLISFSLVVTALFNKGPLAKIIFQPSILYRADYMHAGWKMTLLKPFFGVGMDSYGDWYREVRGSISTLRTGPDRTANTAHNIFLDISSNGGFPLIFAYLFILFLALRAGIKSLRNRPLQSNIFPLVTFICWIEYQVQSLISINQVGVGIWGWILSGMLIGYGKMENAEENIKMEKNRNVKKVKNKKLDKNMKPSVSLIAFGALLIGFILAYIPQSADMKFKSAIQTRNLEKMIASTKVLGSTAWHLNQVINSAITSGYPNLAIPLDQDLRTKYPRDFYGWKVLYLLPSSSPAEKAEALSMLKKLDPFNPDIKGP